MNNLDLNIDNYEIEDIYNLFKLNIKESLNDNLMTNAKKIMLKTHPDKSKLNPEIYIFFNKAYKILQLIYEYQNKSLLLKTKMNTNYSNEIDVMDTSNKNNALNNFFKEANISQGSKEYNSWFNANFEKYAKEDKKDGYEEWLKSTNESNFKVNNKNEMNLEFEKIKKNKYAIIPFDEIKEWNSNSNFGTSLYEDIQNTKIDNKNLNYIDLRQAYEDDVIAIDENSYKSKTLNEIENERSQKINYMTKKESLEYLSKKENEENKRSVMNAHRFTKNFEEKIKNYETNFWGNLYQLKF